MRGFFCLLTEDELVVAAMDEDKGTKIIKGYLP
jgi:hypothetical protein